MKRITLTVLILLLLALTFPSVPNVGATTEDVWVAYGPEDVPTEPMPANFTTDDYLDTTNPYADFVTPQGALDEVDDAEGDNPLYVLVFGDEEERQIVRYTYHLHYLDYLDWRGWAKLQIERGDEALVEKFGIDIRILGFLEWDSDDDLVGYARLVELCQETNFSSGMDVQGAKIDMLVAYTGQAISHDMDIKGEVCTDPDYPEYGAMLITIQASQTDNLVQHEISHLYGTHDHYFCSGCVMCIPDGLNTNNWCATCKETIMENRHRFGKWVPILGGGGGGGECHPR